MLVAVEGLPFLCYVGWRGCFVGPRVGMSGRKIPNGLWKSEETLLDGILTSLHWLWVIGVLQNSLV